LALYGPRGAEVCAGPTVGAKFRINVGFFLSGADGLQGADLQAITTVAANLGYPIGHYIKLQLGFKEYKESQDSMVEGFS